MAYLKAEAEKEKKEKVVKVGIRMKRINGERWKREGEGQTVGVIIGGSRQPGSEERLTGLSAGLLGVQEAPEGTAHILLLLPGWPGLNLSKRALN